MKKWLIITLVVTILGSMGGCSNREPPIKINSSINLDTRIWYRNTLEVHKVEDIYTVIITNGEKVIKTVNFSADRKASNIIRLELIEIDDIQLLLGNSLDSIEDQFGPIHTDTGSGFYIPSYITTDGYLIKLWEKDNVVYSVSRIDLLTGEGIESYSLEEN